MDPLNNSPSSSRSNFGVEMTKEKVKIKIVSLKSDANIVATAKSIEPSGQSLNSRSPASTSPRTASASKNDSAEPPAKSKFLLSKDKDKDTKPKSSQDAEAEYDFDQHLLEEKLTEKNQFFHLIHLAPRTAAEMQATKSSSKIEPKNDQPTDSSKDVKPSPPSVSTSSAPSTKNASSPASTSPNARTLSPQTHTPIDVDRDTLRRPESKTSKRKSREPVKNVTKLKCPPPTLSDSDSNCPQSAITSNNGGSRSPLQSNQSLLPSSTHLHNDRDAMTLKTALNMSEQNKINLKKSLFKQPQQQHQQRQPTLKPSTASGSSSSGSGKESNKSAESETSIIINNVQRPNQADTPRPSFNHNMSPFFFPPKHHQLFSETEIKEIRNDDAMKLKVYGPSMASYDSQTNAMLKTQHMKNVTGSKRSYNLSNQNEPLQMNAPAFLPYHHPHNNQEVPKNKKPKIGVSGNSGSGSSSSPGPIDMKKRLNSTGELEVITSSSSSSKSNATPKRQSEPSNDSVHTLLHNCNITLPSSLSVTLTNDEIESNRSFFNQKKTPVNNSIEIVKLPDESSSPTEQTRYTKAQSNSPSLLSRTENNHSGSHSPVAINLVNNKSASTSHSQNATKPESRNSPVPGTSNHESFQAKFHQFLPKHETMQQLLKPKKKISKLNLMPAPSTPYDPPLTKRKYPFNGPKASMQLTNRIPPRSPVGKLLPPKIDSQLMKMHASAASSHLIPQHSASLSERLLQVTSFANHQSDGSRGGGGSGSSSMSTANKNSHPTIPTSSNPNWTDFAPLEEMSERCILQKYFRNN